MEQNQGIKAWQWIVTVIVIIILAILGYYIFKGNGSSTTEENAPISETPTSTNPTDINRIVVSDQFPGNIVYVTSAQLANPGWIVVHEDNNGNPGAVIGSAYFEKGTSSGRVTLTKSTVEGKLYYAMLHSDDGDKNFNPSKDLPVKDINGNVISKPFRATQNITESKG